MKRAEETGPLTASSVLHTNFNEVLRGRHTNESPNVNSRLQRESHRLIPMRVLIATDAWHPQVNGVVRTLNSLARFAQKEGADIRFLTHDGFSTFPVPSYPGLRLAIPNPSEIERRIEDTAPDAIHIATEGPIGFMTRRYCVRNGIPFTTSYTTKFPEYISARLPIPESWSYSALRRFHGAAKVTMVATESLHMDLEQRGFKNLGRWSRGVDTALFAPERVIDVDFPRPIFTCVGRVAIEKNLDAFLSLDLPGTKMVIGVGPALADLKKRYPCVKFMGQLENGQLAGHLAASDVFVFPSRTDTFGIVQLEALASGVPVAAYPVTGPKDVISGQPVGVLDEDLRKACLAALKLPREECRKLALGYSWEKSAQQFLGHVKTVATKRFQKPAQPITTGATECAQI